MFYGLGPLACPESKLTSRLRILLEILIGLTVSSEGLYLQRAVRHRKTWTYEGASKSFRTGRLEQELQMIELSATRCSCIAIL